jgi:hypothetical protein
MQIKGVHDDITTWSTTAMWVSLQCQAIELGSSFAPITMLQQAAMMMRRTCEPPTAHAATAMIAYGTSERLLH